MISKGEKKKQRKELNKFIEQNVQGINKIGVAASGRHLHTRGAAACGRRPPLWVPMFVLLLLLLLVLLLLLLILLMLLALPLLLLLALLWFLLLPSLLLSLLLFRAEGANF